MEQKTRRRQHGAPAGIHDLSSADRAGACARRTQHPEFKKNAYTEQHLSLLENLASYTTIALDNANAYLLINKREREVSERAAELITINNITQALATQLDQEPLIQLVGEQIRDLFHASIAYISLLDRTNMILRFPYTFGEEAQPRPFGAGLTSQIIRSGPTPADQ